MTVAESAVKTRTPCDPISDDDDLDLKHDTSSDQEEEDAGEEDEEEEQDEEDIVTELSRIEIPSSIVQRKNVNIPKLIKFNKLVFDCPYLVSCHVISTILSINLILGLTTPEELKKMVEDDNISNGKNKNTEYPKDGQRYSH